ncbi:MAG: DEAD/DEAH box helicase [bacterium]|nr:DEAD/DEAH box helicase [bacterium]
MNETFSDLGLKPEIVSALAKLSITSPTAIQISAIPALLKRNNTYLQAETGTGKTLAYLLPLYCRIDPTVGNAQVIVVVPTHELAIQIQRQCLELSLLSQLPIRILLLIGGTSRERQLEKLKKKPHIIIGSPGRIRELIEDRKLKSHIVHSIVIDEADRLITSENLSSLQTIINSTPKDRSLILVSATESSECTKAIATICPDMKRIKTGKASVNSSIEHFYLICQEREKTEMIRKLIHAMTPTRSMIFVHKNDSAEILALKLAHHKMKVIDIHSAQEKEDRKKAMDQIRSGKVDVLIASDLAARGLDIKEVTHVFNFDVPSLSDAYLHRVGRTGRAGAAGVAVTLISGHQERLIPQYSKDLGIIMTEITLREGNVFAVEKKSIK